MGIEKKDLKKVFLSKFRLSLYFLKHMPMGFFNGLRVIEFDDKKASVSVPFNYFTKNPFKSMYFATQSMAAELASGIMALSEISKASKPVSMLVLNMEAEFRKKARSKIIFTCNDGLEISKTIKEAIETNEGRTVTITSTGVDTQGDIVSVFKFNWTFKPKTK